LPNLCRAFGGLPDAAWRVKQSASPPTGGAQEPKEALMSDLAHTAASSVTLHVRRRVLVGLAAAIALAAIVTVLVVALAGGGSTSSSQSQSVASPSQSGPERSTLDRFGARVQESGPEQAAIGRSPVFPTRVPINRDNGPEQAAYGR
jgi:hypothetical protein